MSGSRFHAVDFQAEDEKWMMFMLMGKWMEDRCKVYGESTGEKWAKFL